MSLIPPREMFNPSLALPQGADTDQSILKDLFTAAVELWIPIMMRDADQSLSANLNRYQNQLPRIWRDLAESMSNRSLRFIITEINLARISDALGDGNEQEQYTVWSASLKTASYAEYLFKKYRAFFSAETRRVLNTFRWAVDVLSAVEIEAHEVLKVVPCEELPVVQYIELLGDPHNDGRRVAKVEFQTGTSVMLKPGSARVCEALRAIIEITELRDQLPIVPATAMSRLGYWQEFVGNSSKCKASARPSALKMGALIAFAQHLRMNDLHHENVNSVDGRYVLVDVECAFQPTIGKDSNSFSPLDTGLLPYYVGARGWCHSVEATLPVGGGLIGGVCRWRGWGCRSATGRRSRRPRKRAGRCGGSPVTWGVARR